MERISRFRAITLLVIIGTILSLYSLRLVTLRLIGRNDCKPVFQCLLLFLFNNCYSITELFQIEDLFFSLLFQVKQPSCFRFFARPGKMVETINRKVRREERFPFFIRPGA